MESSKHALAFPFELSWDYCVDPLFVSECPEDSYPDLMPFIPEQLRSELAQWSLDMGECLGDGSITPAPQRLAELDLQYSSLVEKLRAAGFDAQPDPSPWWRENRNWIARALRLPLLNRIEYRPRGVVGALVVVLAIGVANAFAVPRSRDSHKK